MKTVIYYFTGTGNTLAIARLIAGELGDTRLVPLRRAISPLGITPEADAIGIAFPVYYLDMPSIVREFVRQLRPAGKPYIFGIATCGASPGPALHNLDALLGEQGMHLAAGFAFVMPENYIGPVDLMELEQEAEKKNASATGRVQEVAEQIRKRKESIPEGKNTALLRFGGAAFRALMTSVYRIPRRLHATEKCTRCGNCSRICPVRNIAMTPKGPAWNGDCVQCYACIHWCPQEAVELGGRTTGKRRYHHPGVTIRDMMEQRGEV